MRDDEAVDDVEVGRGPPVHPHDAAVLDDELGLGVVRAVRGDETELRQRCDDQLLAKLASARASESLRPLRRQGARLSA